MARVPNRAYSRALRKKAVSSHPRCKEVAWLRAQQGASIQFAASARTQASVLEMEIAHTKETQGRVA